MNSGMAFLALTFQLWDTVYQWPGQLHVLKVSWPAPVSISPLESQKTLGFLKRLETVGISNPSNTKNNIKPQPKTKRTEVSVCGITNTNKKQN